jgi:16S rRNA (cytidine1402-2'-O)-methyltransferase
MNKIIYIVATPIGNLGDISLRAIETLKKVDLILAEDTRRSKILLDHYAITTPLKSFHKFNEKKNISEMAQILASYPSIALVSDAGTPLISDPGGYLIDYALNKQISLVPIPGPSALTTLLSVFGQSGQKAQTVFLGFLDYKEKVREKVLTNLLSSEYKFVFFESPNRINSTIAIISSLDPDAEIVIGRELTKINEEILRFKAKIAPFIKEKGEISVAVNPSGKAIKNNILNQTPEHKSMTKDLSVLLAKYLNLNNKDAYNLLLELKTKSQNNKGIID